ncbi:uncharacterized protein LOC119271974 [Triticum dicoccoides]|uniref:uncharacterized protein LOC119271974 n=1 Tax=Triticum dicoccoides TaxID=85692 RepID=UPI0018902CF7|nr:uncharacterized protein LOC119271974 [Triticum dicoccoides]
MDDTILAQEESDERTGAGVILSKEDQARYAKLLRPNIPPPIDPYSNVAWEDYDQVEERLARVRIACYKIVKPEAAHELKEPEEYTEDELCQESYFRHLDDDESFEWFFHRDDSQKPELNDYQRIVLRNFLPDSCERQYCYHDDYRSRYHTYEIDSVYVKYYGEISKKIKWIADYLHLDRSTEAWRNMYTIAWRQALRIATHFPHMTVHLAAFAYNEYIIELNTYASLKDIDLLYFEIWRLVAKEDRRYLDAVKEVYEMDKFAIHKRVLHAELNALPVFVTIKQMIYSIVKEGGIDLKAKEDEARAVFSKLAFRKHKTMNMAQYAEKKMEIADRLGLDKKVNIQKDLFSWGYDYGNIRFVALDLKSIAVPFGLKSINMITNFKTLVQERNPSKLDLDKFDCFQPKGEAFLGVPFFGRFDCGFFVILYMENLTARGMKPFNTFVSLLIGIFFAETMNPTGFCAEGLAGPHQRQQFCEWRGLAPHCVQPCLDGGQGILFLKQNGYCRK